ncbi:hypothetical protein [Saccharolobus shibatae]|uniref:Uncharacterized protein n=1 Tax=Saccharolobus shibatae TaxID=2286 RepID=A0A8F5GZ79_9CREN|nr:hypothetical protein [Saccharolobus shibatae]QXJ35039.1 hypothetical protein J5U22_01586 [Saccharolobus shibatae]
MDKYHEKLLKRHVLILSGIGIADIIIIIIAILYNFFINILAFSLVSILVITDISLTYRLIKTHKFYPLTVLSGVINGIIILLLSAFAFSNHILEELLLPLVVDVLVTSYMIIRYRPKLYFSEKKDIIIYTITPFLFVMIYIVIVIK